MSAYITPCKTYTTQRILFHEPLYFAGRCLIHAAAVSEELNHETSDHIAKTYSSPIEHEHCCLFFHVDSDTTFHYVILPCFAYINIYILYLKLNNEYGSV